MVHAAEIFRLLCIEPLIPLCVLLDLLAVDLQDAEPYGRGLSAMKTYIHGDV